MKELNFEQMEKVQGGYYCAMICHWITGGGGYQGDWADLYLAWYNNCQAYCSV
jgi:hypothetical protein